MVIIASKLNIACSTAQVMKFEDLYISTANILKMQFNLPECCMTKFYFFKCNITDSTLDLGVPVSLKFSLRSGGAAAAAKPKQRKPQYDLRPIPHDMRFVFCGI